MNFAQLHEALRLEILRRIQSGELTGKLLAFKSRLTQPHISNFVNRRRLLSIEATDRMLVALNLTVSDLLPGGIANQTGRPEVPPGFETVPLVEQAIAIRSRIIRRKDIMLAVPLPRGTLGRFPTLSSSSRRDWDRFVAIRVTAAQAAEMQPVLQPHAILLIDRHYISLHPGEKHSLYAVDTGAGLAIRYVTLKSNQLILHCFSHTDPVTLLEPPPGQRARGLVVGRVCLLLAQV